MYDDEKMFHIGFIMMIVVFIMIALLQISFRLQERDRARTRAEIVRTQQEFAARQTVLSGLVRPENLRGIVAGMYPRFEPIGFRKNITANEIPLRANQ
jgi:hypothetical protein